MAIPGPRGGFFTVYILSPIVGGLTGAAAYKYLVRPGMIEKPEPTPMQEAVRAER